MSLWMWTRRIFFDRTPRWALLELFVMDTLFLTTAIDYANAQPHLGHAYEKVLTDTLARFARRTGRKVRFLSGLDEHGQKVQQSAAKADKSPQEFVDGISVYFLNLVERFAS